MPRARIMMVCMTDESWSDLDDAELRFQSLDEQHPAKVATAFVHLVLTEPMHSDIAAEFVTPEKLSDWGDFSTARSFFLDQALAISTRSLRARNNLDVAYVKLVPDNGTYFSDGPRQDFAAWVTLVWRPELGGWRIHAFGDPIPPELLPRTAKGNAAPVFEGDQEIDVVAG